MSAPFLWIIIPGLFATGLYILRRWKNAVHLAGFLVALFLAWLAWQLPIGEPISLRLWVGFPSWKVGETLIVFGRRFVLDNASRPALIMIYLGIAFWFGGAYSAHTEQLFIPLGLGIASLLTASLAVKPSYYAALIIEAAALVSVPILSPPGKPVKRGVLRFLVFQTIGMCFILFADWSLPLLEIESSNPNALSPNTLLIGLGFALIIAAFPFHTWVPMLAEEAQPYSAAFIFYILPTAILFLVIEYLNRYTQLGIYPLMYPTLRAFGVMMVLTGGVWAAFERHLGRIFGFAAILQIGMALLAVSLGDAAGQGSPLRGIFFAHLVPQGVGLALWALALRAIQSRGNELGFSDVRGLARRLPIATSCLVLANFSLAGLPLLASFPVDVALWSALTQRSLGMAVLSLLGNACLLAAGIRTLFVSVTGSSQEGWQISERGLQVTLLVLGGVLLFVVGLMPQWFFPSLTDMALIFSAPSP